MSGQSSLSWGPARGGSGLVGWLTVSLALLATHVVIWLTLRFSLPLHRVLGESMIRVLTRIFGLLLAAIAVQMMADGVFAYIDSHS